MEKIRARRSIHSVIDSKFAPEIDKIIMGRKHKSTTPPRVPSVTKMDSGHKSPDHPLESASLGPESQLSDSTLLSAETDENKSGGEDERDYKNTSGRPHREVAEPNIAKMNNANQTAGLKPSKSANSWNPLKEVNVLSVILPVVIAILPAVIILTNIVVSSNEQAAVSRGGNSIDSEFVNTAIDNLSKDYPRQLASTWERLAIGIKDVKTHSRPTVFMLVHEGMDDFSNPIAKRLGVIASTYLSTANKSVILTPEDLDEMDDHGELNTKYKKDLEISGSMVVLNLENAPGKIAQGLRYYCDDYNPLIRNLAVFLTVNLRNCNVDLQKFRESAKAVDEIAEKCLKNKWSGDLGEQILQPLSVRLMGVVLKIVPEN